DAVGQLTAESDNEHVIVLLCKIVSFVVGPGHIRHAGFTNAVVIGEMDNRHTNRIVEMRKAFNHAGVETNIASDIQVALWMKFLFIASFSGVGAIANAPAGILRTDPELRAQM